MRHFSSASVITVLLLTTASISWASTNLNSSRSNIYRAVYDVAAVTPAQAAAILKELDALGPGVNETTVRKLLEKHGAKAGLIKKIGIRPPERTRKETLILLLSNPADEAQAIAVSDEGVPGPKSAPKK